MIKIEVCKKNKNRTIEKRNQLELMNMIEQEENKLVKKGGWKALKVAALSSLGLSWLPFIQIMIEALIIIELAFLTYKLLSD